MSPTVSNTGFIHRFIPGNDPARKPLLMLHGTGGDESDLLPLGSRLSPGAALLSPRGKVLENGMPRFFHRLAEGVFDEADVKLRAGELAGFIAEARQTYDLAAPIAVGFSNGANIAAALLLMHEGALSGAILLRAMTPLSEPPTTRQAGVPVLVLSGMMDPIVPADNAATLVQALETVGHKVEQQVLPAGHNLSQTDLTLAAEWLTRFGA
ncbi:alpha/beta hydrolase [Allorhizobium undicola]|uniref:alpha/beta hydrolase n=1 Tax=Allorhizobium undicola TaxID=78527 RepID=UPI003D341C9F